MGVKRTEAAARKRDEPRRSTPPPSGGTLDRARERESRKAAKQQTRAENKATRGPRRAAKRQRVTQEIFTPEKFLLHIAVYILSAIIIAIVGLVVNGGSEDSEPPSFMGVEPPAAPSVLPEQTVATYRPIPTPTGGFLSDAQAGTPTFDLQRSTFIQTLIDDDLYVWKRSFPDYVVGHHRNETRLPMSIQVHGRPSVTHLLIRTDELTALDLLPLIATLDSTAFASGEHRLADLQAVLDNEPEALITTDILTISPGISPEQPIQGWITLRAVP